MRRVPIWTILPLLLLAACQSTSPQSDGNRQCTPRAAEAGQCRTSSIPVFSELSSVR